MSVGCPDKLDVRGTVGDEYVVDVAPCCDVRLRLTSPREPVAIHFMAESEEYRFVVAFERVGVSVYDAVVRTTGDVGQRVRSLIAAIPVLGNPRDHRNSFGKDVLEPEAIQNATGATHVAPEINDCDVLMRILFEGGQWSHVRGDSGNRHAKIH